MKSPSRRAIEEDNIALRLGRLVIASARVELSLQQIAEFLGTPEAGHLSQQRQLRAIKRGSKGHSDSEALSDWAVAANDLLAERGQLVHGEFLGRWQGNLMGPAYIAHKRGEVIDVDLNHLDDLVDVARRLAGEGGEHSRVLFQELVEGDGGE